jgi:hypothetical protein
VKAVADVFGEVALLPAVVVVCSDADDEVIWSEVVHGVLDGQPKRLVADRSV